METLTKTQISILHYWNTGIRSALIIHRKTKIPLSTNKYNLKKLRESLILKHKPTSMLDVDPVVDEIQSYLKLDINCDDVLQFWQSSGNTFPNLKSLAQIVLAIPATSTPSEQVFSTMGLILNTKRTMLLPENVGKVQMIHDNYKLF